jgi:hypothetical protein
MRRAALTTAVVAVIGMGALAIPGDVLPAPYRPRAPNYDQTATGSSAAAEGGGGLVYSVDSAGETTVSFTTADGDTFDFSPHSLQRLTQRGVPIDDVTSLLDDSSSRFRYFHDGAWKTGFYDPSSGLFVGTANGNVTTVIGNASQNYINNLMAAQP